MGIRAVLEVIRVAERLERLTLADNWLNNESVKELVGVIGGLPNLHYLDLSRNPISHSAGKILSEYASRNASVYFILLEGTLINPALIRIVHQKAEANRIRANVEGPSAQGCGVVAPPAPAPPSQRPPEQRSRPVQQQTQPSFTLRQPPKPPQPPASLPSRNPSSPPNSSTPENYSMVGLLSVAAEDDGPGSRRFISLLHQAGSELDCATAIPSFNLLMQVCILG